MDQSEVAVSSLEGYGVPVIDLSSVIGTMRNVVPERIVRATGTMMRMNIDDGDIFLADFENGAIGSIRSSVDAGAVVQEIINTIELSFREHRWTNLPLPSNEMSCRNCQSEEQTDP